MLHALRWVCVPVCQWAERDGGGGAVLPALSNADLGTRHLASHLTPVPDRCSPCAPATSPSLLLLTPQAAKERHGPSVALLEEAIADGRIGG